MRLWPWYSEDAVARVASRVRRGDNLGAHRSDDDVAEFEDLALARLGPAGCHTLSYSSGTGALFATYRALGLDGRAVLVPTYTFRATVTALVAAGGKPIFYDCDPETGLVAWDAIDGEAVRRADAIVVTHMNGLINDLDRLGELARKHVLQVVEDCSHVHGAVDHLGRRPGFGADAAVYSVGTTKLVTGGLGGVAFYRHQEHYERAVLLSQQKWRIQRLSDASKASHVGDGFHLRMSPLAAILASDHLRRLDEILSSKQHNVDAFCSAVESTALSPVRPSTVGGRQGLYKLNLRIPEQSDRGAVLAALTGRGLAVRVPNRPVHREVPFSGAAGVELPGADIFSRRVVEFPAFDMHDPSNLPKIIAGVLSAAREAGL